ncbi:laccase-2-like [Trichogramma pretiosum]|uniref:laccase-2-like n=1 Tax=Trichogramma pretiosum TaxID=7493 RepID=UPI000C719C68|nr:laccase-2-like [Trichogramma pretiosum]
MLPKNCNRRAIAYFFLPIFLATFEPTDAVLSYEDEYYFCAEADRYNWTSHPCKRTCKDGEPPRQCLYVFVVEQYSTMSKACYDCPFNMADCYRPHCLPGDGRPKTVFTANRQMPGTPIEVCQNDLVVVEVRNTMLSESTTIHWHGFKQRGTPYMDGVPFVSQCPILPGQTFQYIFNATEAGTYFWHSHIGSQRADGLYGPLIVRPYPRSNPHRNLYTHDVHCMLLTDWMVQEGDDGFVEMYHYRSRVRPETLLINGLGRYQPFRRNNTRGQIFTPTETFMVQRGNRYRFRMIDAGAEDCPIEMSIDNHKLWIVSLDSNDVDPVEVDSLTIWPGERIDFVINANQRVGNYWIRYRGHGQCEPSNTTTGIYQVAILRYNGAANQNPSSAVGYNIPPMTNTTRIFNPYNRGTEAPPYIFINVPDLNATAPNDPSLTRRPDVQHYINFDFYPIDNYDFHRQNLYGYNQVPADRRMGTFQLNHISLKFPPFPLLSQWEEIGPDTLCNRTHTPRADCQREHCACTHVIQVGLNQVVELVLVDEGRYVVANHPLHLHGHFFRVVATENLRGNVTIDRIKEMDRRNQIRRRLDRAPIKDTMKAPGGGYTILRFHANNPGYWFFHCHFEQHTNVGMSLIFKVGEHNQFPPKPQGFPKCGSYTPITGNSFNEAG